MKRLALLAMAQDGQIENRKSGKREAAQHSLQPTLAGVIMGRRG